MPKTEREYKLIIPKWDNEGHKIKSEVIEKYAGEMSDKFGGVSITPSVLGCWKDKGKIQCEENIELVSGRDIPDTTNGRSKIFEEDKKFLRKLAKQIGTDLGQDSIYVTEDIVKDISFIKGEYREKLPPAKLGIKWFEKLI